MSRLQQPDETVHRSINSSLFPISSTLPLNSTERETNEPILSQANIKKRGRPRLTEEAKRARELDKEQQRIAKKNKQN